jgi:hypothetical protein
MYTQSQSNFNKFPLNRKQVVYLSLSLLHDPTIPYSKFKKAHRDAKLLFEYKVKVLAQCFCPECVNFKSKKKWYDPESNKLKLR